MGRRKYMPKHRVRGSLTSKMYSHLVAWHRATNILVPSLSPAPTMLGPAERMVDRRASVRCRSFHVRKYTDDRASHSITPGGIAMYRVGQKVGLVFSLRWL